MTQEEIEKQRELEEAIKILEKTNFRAMSEMLISIIREYGNFIEKLGNTEKEYENAFKALEIIGKSPSFLDKVVRKASPEEFGVFMRIFIQMSTLEPQLRNVSKLSPDEKISLGKTLIEISSDLDKLYKAKVK